jgi:hypothetical protein
LKYLTDTCIISEIIRPFPNKQVADWLERRDEKTLFLSVLTLGEIYKGISKLPESKKKNDIRRWMRRIEKWADRFDSWTDFENAPDGNDPDDEEFKAFEKEGIEIWKALRKELAPDYEVAYNSKKLDRHK